MFSITKPETVPVVTLDDTDAYTAALTVHQHREKLTATLTPEQLEELACAAHKLAQQLVTERDADAADAARPRMEHAFDLATAAEHLTEATAAATPSLDDVLHGLDKATRYAWIVRPERAGIGLWDRQEDKVAWWNRVLSETGRSDVQKLVENDKAEWLIWIPAAAYQPFTIAVLS